MKTEQRYYKEKRRAFTLIEVLIIIVIIAVLAAIIVVTVNPGEKLAETRDNKRETHLNIILSAIKQKTLMDRGDWNCVKGNIPEVFTTISSNNYDLYNCIYPEYLSERVYDPMEGEDIDENNYNTKYEIKKDLATEIITLYAPGGETRTIYRGEK